MSELTRWKSIKYENEPTNEQPNQKLLNMLTKATIVFVLVLISLIATFEVASAQTSPPPLIALSSSQLNFYGEEHVASALNRTISIVGLVNQTVIVTIVSGDLYNNNTGTSIPHNNVEIDPSSFTLSKNEVGNVTISLKTAGTNTGTYQGTILVTATTDTSNVTVSNITITAKIDIQHPLWVKIGIISIILVLFGVALLFGEEIIPPEKYSKSKLIKSNNVEQSFPSPRFIVVLCGLVAISLWLILITTPELSFTDNGNIVSTVLIVPFMGYLVSIVKGKKDNGKKETK